MAMKGAVTVTVSVKEIADILLSSSNGAGEVTVPRIYWIPTEGQRVIGLLEQWLLDGRGVYNIQQLRIGLQRITDGEVKVVPDPRTDFLYFSSRPFKLEYSI